MYEDKTLVCKECGNEFVFTAGEQEFYAEKGFVNEPQRCKSCREPERTLQSLKEKCTLLHARHAAARLRFLLSLEKTVRYIAANVSQK